MNTQNLHKLIDSCILLPQEKKDFLKHNFCVYSKVKQERMVSMLEKIQNINATRDDFEVFAYGMKMWKSREKLKALEADEEKLGA